MIPAAKTVTVTRKPRLLGHCLDVGVYRHSYLILWKQQQLPQKNSKKLVTRHRIRPVAEKQYVSGAVSHCTGFGGVILL